MDERSDVWIWVGLVLMALAGWAGYHFFLAEKLSSPSVADSAISRNDDQAGGLPPETVAPAPPLPALSDVEAGATRLPEPPPDVEPLPSSIGAMDVTGAQRLLGEVADRLSSRPELKTWLASRQVVRNFVAAVDLVAHGESPAPHITFFLPQERFRPVDREGRLLMAPSSFARYDLPVLVFASLNTRECVRMYRQLEPVFVQAYREMGYPEADFRGALIKACAVLLETPVVDGDIELRARASFFQMADPRLEGLNKAQKHLLRMGPANVRRVQTKIRELVDALRAA